DLHDGIIQSIYAVSLSLEDVTDLVTSDPDEAAARVDRAIDRLQMTIADIRTFITGLGPDSTCGLGLALESMASDLLAGSGTALSMDLSGAAALDARLSPEAGHELVQIAREALSNVARRSGAARASLDLRFDGEIAELRVQDDGGGFDPRQRFGS